MIQEERSLLNSLVHCIVDGKLCLAQTPVPISHVGRNKVLQDIFNDKVDSLSLAITLRVPNCGKTPRNSQMGGKRLIKLVVKLRTSVRNDHMRQSLMLDKVVNMLNIHVCPVNSIRCASARHCIHLVNLSTNTALALCPSAVTGNPVT